MRRLIGSLTAAVIAALAFYGGAMPLAAQGHQGKGNASVANRKTPGKNKVQGPKITIGGSSVTSTGKKLTPATEEQFSGPSDSGLESTTLPASQDSVVGGPVVGTNVRAAGGPSTGTQSEISMASSNSSIVITYNGGPNGSGFATSTNAGVTFSANASPPVPGGSSPCCDPAVVSDLAGRFYFLQIFFNDGAGNCTNSVHRSTDGGVTFSSIIGSPFSYASGSTDFPDMPHMAIDRMNLVAGQPQLYTFTRHFVSGINCPATGTGGSVQGEVTCSTNGGTTWTAPTVLGPFTDNAHMATGSDGSVYLAGNGIGTMGGTTKITLRRSTASCAGGLAFGSPATVADNQTFATLNIDREFPQPYVGVDKVNPNIAYVAWSADRLTSDGDRDIWLARCTFSGTTGTCQAPVRVNDNTIADGTQQYFPMMCVDPNNVINISWNDQRAGSGSTAIYHAEVGSSGASLAVSPNFLTSQVNFTPFNFGGTPDYGDYNENNDACDANHFYVAWSSQASPLGMTPASNDVDVFLAVVNNIPDIRVDSPLNFTTVCPGAPSTHQLQVFNVGDAPLTINSVTRLSGSTDITVGTNPTTPFIIQPGSEVDIPITCTVPPLTTPGTVTAVIRIASNDPDQPTLDLNATCVEGAGTISVSGSTDFGNVCAETTADKTLSVCNVGTCDLHVTGAPINCGGGPAQFTIQNNPFPATVSHDACLNLTIRFTPTSDGPKSCTLTINSDSNGTSTASNFPLTGNTPLPSIDVPLSLAFPPTVIQSVGACTSLKPFPVSNTGSCNLTITNMSIAPTSGAFTNGGDYGFSGLPSTPIILQPGHIAGEGNLKAVFAPTALDRDRLAQLRVVYVNDPVTGATTTVDRPLCGEGVRTGARVLVTSGGSPLANVDKIMIQRATRNSNKNLLNTVDVAQNLTLMTVTPASPCLPFQYHREYGTVSNQIQLLPGSYVVTVQATIAGKKQSKTVGFDVNTCGFNPNIVVAF